MSATQRIYGLLADLKTEATICGRFPEGFRGAWAFDDRKRLQVIHGFKPFRCGKYNRLVRQINSLEFVMLQRDEWNPNKGIKR